MKEGYIEKIMNEERIYYKDSISEMVSTIHNVEWLRSIYSFIKVFADDEEGKAWQKKTKIIRKA